MRWWKKQITLWSLYMKQSYEWGWIITTLRRTSSHFSKERKKKQKHIVELEMGGLREGTDCWQQSDCNPSVSKSVPTVYGPTPIHTKKKKKEIKVICQKKYHNDNFVMDFNFLCGNCPVCVDRLIMICAFVSLPVVLLDTTSVLGELGWKTYPINGVRRATFDFFSPSACPLWL